MLTTLAGSCPAGKDKIRLYGIDAPEKTQSCTDAKGQTYSCGQASTQALQQKVGSKPLRCEVSSREGSGLNVSHTVVQSDNTCANLSSGSKVSGGCYEGLQVPTPVSHSCGLLLRLEAAVHIWLSDHSVCCCAGEGH